MRFSDEQEAQISASMLEAGNATSVQMLKLDDDGRTLFKHTVGAAYVLRLTKRQREIQAAADAKVAGLPEGLAVGMDEAILAIASKPVFFRPLLIQVAAKVQDGYHGAIVDEGMISVALNNLQSLGKVNQVDNGKGKENSFVAA